MKKIIAATLAPALLCLAAGQAQAFDNRVTLGALGGTTGVGAELSWRFHKRLGVTAQYASGLDWDGEFDTDEVDYEGDIGLSAGALKVDYYPFAGRFYLTAGAMLPDMEANVRGTAKEQQDFEFNGNLYTTDEIGALQGQLTIADGVRPYAGIGWRSSHRTGFGVFSEIGVMATNVDVSLSSSNNYEATDPLLRADLRQEEQELKDEAEKLPFYPVAVLGISYTF
ncbi:hypothetical protein VRRI112168_13170 [Vreelandella rituensis]|uniref:Outer membrane protein domain-containing protein n=1 Tax=Vreelandella rituensis TaxID=2282306 RepID=A0A368TXZ8_9GAMM|nr:hypothetical protein [Halomonas rituensis]RCV89604.1 hypothetical protein DU506_12595 [Halomonas rituensis]